MPGPSEYIESTLGPGSANEHICQKWRKRSRNSQVKQHSGDRQEKSAGQRGSALFISSIALAVLCVLIFAVAHGDYSMDCNALNCIGGMVVESAYVWSVNFYLIGFAVALVLLLRSRRQGAARFCVVAALGIGLTFGNGASAGLSEISMFLGIAILFAFLIDMWVTYLFPAFLPVAVALSFCVFFVEAKFKAPYAWWQVASSPVRTTECADAGGALRGLCMPPDDYASIVGIENAILKNSSAGEEIYVYPHMPIFYLLTSRRPFDNAVVSWFDFTSDQLADDVSRRLRTSPPSVIIMAEIPNSVLTAHEHLFRNDKPLPQRRILASIAALKSSGLIRRIDHVENLNGLTIDVYKRVTQ